MGDTPSLDQLVREHLPSLLRLATRLTGDADRAEELAQEALARAARSWTTFRGEAGFRTWFFRIAINAYRDELSRRRLDVVSLDAGAEPVDASHATPGEEAMATELGELVTREIARLPPRQREVLALVAYEGLSTVEVSRVLEISEQNVHATLSAARARLKERLAPYLDISRRES